jgi:SnoaL-like protein
VTAPLLKEWLEKYRQAWESRDADLAAALFTDEATCHETPFGRPAKGKDGVRSYWSGATAHQRNVNFDAGIARWCAEFTRVPSGVRTRLDGVFLLEFDAAGSCRSLREWWHRTESPP